VKNSDQESDRYTNGKVAFSGVIQGDCMSRTSLFLLGADTLLFIHVLFVVFVVFGLLLIWIGKYFSWAWVRNPWFRLLHLICIGIVVVQAWAGVICPLTTWEMALRERAGDAIYSGSFIGYWLNAILYYEAPEWVFTLVYSVFGSLVIGSWIWVRPDRFS
jgi:hypothetical protein